jgi:hypothetical protein
MPHEDCGGNMTMLQYRRMKRDRLGDETGPAGRGDRLSGEAEAQDKDADTEETQKRAFVTQLTDVALRPCP